MSFFHYLHIGHLNEPALREHKVVLDRPLDMNLTEKLFHEFGGFITPEGKAMLDGEPFYSCDEGDCLVCQIPHRYSKAVEFIYELAKQAGCRIATVEGGGSSSPEQFLAGYARKMESPTPPQPAKSN